MARCLSCGRRTGGVHQPCNTAPAAPAREPEPLPEVPGFEPLRLLGAGGFGRVALARRRADGVEVALKVARPGPEAEAQLRREEDLLGAAGAPLVPAVLEAGRTPAGEPWLALELLGGRSLAALLEAASGALAAPAAAAAARSLCQALAALHARGLAHGDLKPENVFVEGDRARLLDLGLAERLAAPAAGPAAPAGTAEYMAPELGEGHRPGARSDVYAAGAILYELFSGRPPFFGPPGEVRHAHLTRRPPRLGALAPVAPQLEALVLRCLAKAPAERPASGAELAAGLAEALGQAAAPAQAGAAPASPRASRRRVAVLFLESPAGALALQAAAQALGGSVAHADRGRSAWVFDPATGDNPARLALRAARAALARGLAQRARVDLLLVTAQPRPGGGERWLSPAFAQPGSWPGAGAPPGIEVAGRAAEVLAGEPLEPLPGAEGLFRAEPVERAEEPATVVRQAVAPLLGRDPELAALVAAAREAFLGRSPTLALVAGEPGTGKSHLGAALADRLRQLMPVPEVLQVRARGPAEAAEGGVLRALARAALDLPAAALAPPDGGRALLGLSLGPEDEPLWPGAALALGWIEPGDPLLAAGAAAPGALASLSARAASALLRRRASVRPLAVVLDDAHLAEAAALDALEHAALAESGAPLFACALARPAFAAARPSWGERAAARRDFTLGPLPVEAAEALCRQLLLPAEGVPAAAVARLVERAQRLPMHLVELARGLKRSGAVRRRPGGTAHYLATDLLDRVPDMPLVEWLAERELRALPVDLATHAWLLALLGDEVSPVEVAGVLAGLEASGQGSSFPLDPGAATRRLLSLGVLTAHRGGRTGFRLSMLRDAVARAAPEKLRAAIHQAACAFYGREESLPRTLRLRRLAVHAAAAGKVTEAAAAHRQLAAAALARHDWVDAEQQLSRALEAPESPALRLEGLRARGNARVRLGRMEDAVADLGAAGQEARGLGEVQGEVDCLLDQATALDFMQQFDLSRERVEEAATLARPADAGSQARLELARGRSLFRSARWAEGAAALETAAALAARAGDAAYETWAVAELLLGTSLPHLGRAAEAAAALDRVAAEAEARGDLLHLCVAHNNRRNLLVARGDLAGAVAGQLEAIRIGRELGVVPLEYMGCFNIAELYYQAGDLASAEPSLRRALELEDRHPEVNPVPSARLLAARQAAFAAGPAGRERRQELERARTRAAAERGALFGPSEAVLCDLCDLATRQAGDEEWAALLHRSAAHSVEQEPIEVRELHGLSLRRAGREEAARAALAEALALCDRIPNLLRRRVEAELAA